MRAVILAFIFLFVYTNAPAQDTVVIRGHQYIFERTVPSYSPVLKIWVMQDTGKTKLLEFDLSYDFRDEFGGACNQTTYELHHDTLILYTRKVSWGEQRPWGWDDVTSSLSKSTYVFQSSGKIVLLTRIYGTDDPAVGKEVESKTHYCVGG